MTNTLIKNGLILTINKDRDIIQNGSIHIEEDKIVKVCKNREIKNNNFDKIIDASNKIVMPGLVNAHNHVNETIIRGLGADGLNEDRKNRNKYYWDIGLWKNFNKQICYDAGALSAVEMIKSGITTTQNSHYINFHKDSIDGIAESILSSGMRIVLGRACWDVSGLAPEEYLDDVKSAKREIERLIMTWNKKKNGRIIIRSESSRFIQCSDEMILKTKEISQKHEIGWAIHLVSRLGEHPIDPRNKDPNIQRYNGRSVEYLSDLGVLGPESLLIHCGPQITNREIKILASKKTPIAHCPVMNAWAGRPHITPIPHMLNMGVTIGLGTDGASTNDSQDLFQVMKTCALLHKVNNGYSKAITAEQVLELSTIDAARALQLENSIGSIETGKKADIIILDRHSPGLTPTLLPTKNLVYGIGCSNAVETVLIDGKIVMKNNKITTLDEKTTYRNGEKAAQKLLDLSGEPEKYLNLMIPKKWQIK